MIKKDKHIYMINPHIFNRKVIKMQLGEILPIKKKNWNYSVSNYEYVIISANVMCLCRKTSYKISLPKRHIYVRCWHFNCEMVNLLWSFYINYYMYKLYCDNEKEAKESCHVCKENLRMNKTNLRKRLLTDVQILWIPHQM